MGWRYFSIAEILLLTGMSLGSAAITAERSTAEILLLTGMRLGSAAITAERKFADSSPYLGKTLKDRQTECSSSASDENTLCQQVEFQHVRYLPYMHTSWVLHVKFTEQY